MYSNRLHDYYTIITRLKPFKLIERKIAQPFMFCQAITGQKRSSRRIGENKTIADLLFRVFEMNNFFAVTFKRRRPLIEPLPEPLIEPLPGPSKKIIRFIGRNKGVNRLKIISQLRLSRATATRHLSELKKKGMIKHVGSKKKGYYILTGRKPKKKLKSEMAAVDK